MSTYAVIESGGKQYKVEKGTSLLVDRLSAKEGDKVALRPVMFRDTEVVAGASIPICLGDHLTLTRLALRCFVDGSQLWLASRAA